MSHFDAIGFAVADTASLVALAKDAAKQGRPVRAERPDLPPLTFYWDAGRGLGVWVYAREAKPGDELEILSCLPSFLPEERTRLRAWRLARLEAAAYECRLTALLDSGRRLHAVLLNPAWRPALPVKGADLVLHLFGLALESELYAAAEAPRLVDPLAGPGSAPREEALWPIDAEGHARLLGVLSHVREVVNFHTGARLWALAVQAEGIVLPVLTPTASLPRPPLLGDVFMGTVWLAASLPAQE